MFGMLTFYFRQLSTFTQSQSNALHRFQRGTSELFNQNLCITIFNKRKVKQTSYHFPHNTGTKYVPEHDMFPFQLTKYNNVECIT